MASVLKTAGGSLSKVFGQTIDLALAGHLEGCGAFSWSFFCPGHLDKSQAPHN